MSSPYVRRFDQLRATDAAIAGGKGASLGELTAAGAPVPPGFVVITAAWHRFLEHGELRRPLLEMLQSLTMENAAEISRRATEVIATAPLDPDVTAAIVETHEKMALGAVAVRSSATAEDGAASAWAGQLDTWLDIGPERLVDHVRMCWASLFTERALVYRLDNEAGRFDIDVAVVVQQMVDADVAGVGFSVHPTTLEPDLMLIQGAFGLGEAVVSGSVRPDSWVVCKRTERIVERAIAPQSRALRPRPGGEPAWDDLSPDVGRAPALDDAQVLAYARILAGIERHYGRPMDTEWALQRQLHVVQARPITTLVEGYDADLYDAQLAWAPAYRRPFDLFASSLFAHTLDYTMSQSFGLAAFPMLLVELAPRSVELFLVATEHGRLNDTVRKACDRDAAHVRSLLERGAAVEQKISDYQARGGVPYDSIEAALEDFYPAVALGSQVPIVVCDVLGDDPGPHADLLAQAQQNRAVSSYPWFIDTVFPALLRARFEALGLGDVEHPTRVATIDDLITPDPATLRARADQVRQGMLHLYQRVGGKARIAMLPSTGFIMARLSGARVPSVDDDARLLRGSAAYAGEVEAVARVLLRPDEPPTALADGEVLVTVNANPSFMPFIRRCAALVTDEGGASCHAAIIARELKKPCVMGTGDATRRIRSGQRVRVDAFAQTVTLLD